MPRNDATMRIVLALSIFLSGAAAHAEPMTAEEFEQYTTGKTLFFGENGQAYGAEQYLKNRRVFWSFLDGECKEGRWYPEDENICFVYEDGDGPQCWTFTRSPSGLIAQYQGDPAEQELYEAQDLNEEMLCLGPEIGV